MSLTDRKNFDAQFRAMPIFPGLRHFKDGISKIKQWTGSDHKQLQRIFVSALVGATADPVIVRAGCCLLDFIYLAQYQSHTDETLLALQRALNDFHAMKDVFIDHGCHEHFNIPKLHSLLHYVDTIKNLGSLDGLNTENSERLHIDYAKKAYAASSQKDYTIQMTKWLQRQEAVIWFTAYLAWRHGNPSSDPSTDSDSDEGAPHLATHASCHGIAMLSTSSSTGVWYRVSQWPHFPKKTLGYLEQQHGAVGFLGAIRAFVNNRPQGRQFFELNANDHFDIFSNIVISQPSHEHMSNKHTARIRSHPQHSNGVRKPTTPARFDTVLVRDNGDSRAPGGLHGRQCSRRKHVLIFFFRPLCGRSSC